MTCPAADDAGNNGLIGIVNFGLGNVKAIETAYQKLNANVSIVSSPDELKKTSKIILPGVGSFDWAMQKLTESGLRPYLDELVLEKRTPVLGICVGMQLMAKSSEEGDCEGLGWLDAVVKKLHYSGNAKGLPLPHMGWNNATPVSSDGLFLSLSKQRFYFLHSYYFSPFDENIITSHTEYGIRFASAVTQNNISGVQFHPEKSHGWGLKILSNFLTL